jgi:hypothetical protein
LGVQKFPSGYSGGSCGAWFSANASTMAKRIGLIGYDLSGDSHRPLLEKGSKDERVLGMARR